MSEVKSSSNRRVAGKLLVVVLAMFGFGFALVPLYDIICDITGYGGKLEQGAVGQSLASEVDESRLVTVEFVASVNNRAGWDFRPAVAKMQVHPGQLYTTSYFATNRLDERVIGQASYNLAPGKAARHFAKPDCFCFTEQAFAPREARELPVTFFVNPSLPREVETVTLSYTFFDVSDRRTQ
jgi:cytochrome c oxidase assembly protein subunit 11